MSDNKILVIDDSATIRRVADSYLSSAGYHVVLAATAEEGVKMAAETRPNLILLDHQLPGTTGYEVCQRLLESPDLASIPVVISSTLRKKAYAEYTELPNVVDMLPKPYSAELLTTTVSNALDTGTLVVASQAQGTAMPEVIQELNDPDLSGTFQHFHLREVLDFLNNASKSGVLEVEAKYQRVSFYLDDGKILGVSATGVAAQELTDRLPESLQSLAPVLNLTLTSRSCAEIDGISQLLDRKVLDPRLLRKLLRHQAALLAFRCFTQELLQFRFQSKRAAPPLHRKLPLDISLLALLIDGALLCDEAQLPADLDEYVYARRATRGQNLDRSGVSAQHVKLLSLLDEARSTEDLVRQLHCDTAEVSRVLYGLSLAGLVDRQDKSRLKNIVVLEPEMAAAKQLQELFGTPGSRYTGKVVRDRLALQLVLKRTRPDALIVSMVGDASLDLVREFYPRESLAGVKWIAITMDESQASAQWDCQFDAVLRRPYTTEQLRWALDEVFESGRSEVAAGKSAAYVSGARAPILGGAT